MQPFPWAAARDLRPRRADAIPRLSQGTAAQILIPEPSALKTLDSERIVVASGPRLFYYPDAQWPDRMPRVYQAKAIEAFEKSKKAKAVGRPGEGLSIDYQIITNVRAFEFREESKDSGYAHIEVFVKIMDDRNGRIVATRTLTGDAAVENTPTTLSPASTRRCRRSGRTGALDAQRDLSRCGTRRGEAVRA